MSLERWWTKFGNGQKKETWGSCWTHGNWIPEPGPWGHNWPAAASTDLALLQESESSRPAAAAATSEPGTWMLPVLRPSPLDALYTGFSFENSSCFKVWKQDWGAGGIWPFKSRSCTSLFALKKTGITAVSSLFDFTMIYRLFLPVRLICWKIPQWKKGC